MKTYITYDPATGEPTGCFRQDPPAAHTNRLDVDDAQAIAWVSLWVDPATKTLVAPPVKPVGPPAVPMRVTKRQGKQALILADLIDLVQPAINAIPNPKQRKIMQSEWDDSQEFQRDRPSLIAIGTAIGLNAAQLDQLFITAATL